MSDILVAREARSKHIQSLIDTYKYKTIAVMKLNVVGHHKNPINMRFICLLFDDKIRKEFQNKIIFGEKISSLDGDYYYYVIEEEGNIVKEKTMFLEDNHFLGRLIDIDVYNEQSISRSDMACEMRKCLICDNYAHICARNQSHSLEEIHKAVDGMIEDNLIEIIHHSVMRAIYDELYMYPKFGLVSHKDSGIHRDMNYETFVQSIFAIKPYIKEFISYGVKRLDHPKELQQLGLEAEAAMLEATNGINTQKGLIFALGIFLPALSKAIINNRDEAYIISEIRQQAQTIIGDYYAHVEDKKDLSHGDQIYIEYGVKGIRGEALQGFKKIFEIPTYNYLEYDDRNHEYMVHIMKEICDTTIIHRLGFKTMKQIQLDMDDFVRRGGYRHNKEEFLQINQTYKEMGVSPGGASDLLVLKMIYEDLQYLICHSELCGIKG